ncbi:MAG: outer membrane lipoprotein chaperone LolA [Gammaproteobacteria bacterium]|nr:outer membrane lipoprotein chaperone LolA [Gammaproteobacteria bacterium]
MKYWFLIAISLILGVVSARMAVADDRALLRERLVVMTSFSADFTQEVQNARGEILERSTGFVRILRPNFKWVVDDPYPQIIVSEGDTLKVYDPDLEQLIVRPLSEVLVDTPLSLLTQEEVVLGDNFQITRVVKETETTFVLVPRASDTLYAEIHLHFTAQSMTGISILDHLGQYTNIRFTLDDRAAVIQSDEFVLQVPPGTDVIGG